MYVYVSVCKSYIHIHTHTYTYIRIHTHTYIHTYTYIHIHTHILTWRFSRSSRGENKKVHLLLLSLSGQHQGCNASWSMWVLTTHQPALGPPPTWFGQWYRALDVYKLMQQESVSANTITFSALISACEKGGQWKRALYVYNLMQQESVSANTITFKTSWKDRH